MSGGLSAKNGRLVATAGRLLATGTQGNPCCCGGGSLPCGACSGGISQTLTLTASNVRRCTPASNLINIVNAAPSNGSFELTRAELTQWNGNAAYVGADTCCWIHTTIIHRVKYAEGSTSETDFGYTWVVWLGVRASQYRLAVSLCRVFDYAANQITTPAFLDPGVAITDSLEVPRVSPAGTFHSVVPLGTSLVACDLITQQALGNRTICPCDTTNAWGPWCVGQCAPGQPIPPCPGPGDVSLSLAGTLSPLTTTEPSYYLDRLETCFDCPSDEWDAHRRTQCAARPPGSCCHGTFLRDPNSSCPRGHWSAIQEATDGHENLA